MQMQKATYTRAFSVVMIQLRFNSTMQLQNETKTFKNMNSTYFTSIKFSRSLFVIVSSMLSISMEITFACLMTTN